MLKLIESLTVWFARIWTRREYRLSRKKPAVWNRVEKLEDRMVMSVDWASVWQPYNTTARASQPGDVSYVKATEFKATALNTEALTRVLATAPLESSSTSDAIEVALADRKVNCSDSRFSNPRFEPRVASQVFQHSHLCGQRDR